MLGNLLMAWRVYRICGAEFWRLVGELALTYLLPLPFFAAVAFLFPVATWSRFTASAVVAVAIAAVFVLRFRRPFQSFFFSEEVVAQATTTKSSP
jgi:positive regulator of sigma E activity